MSKDPAFLFYPGDYLRDTQCLSESVQVAYDRIMCEHMRNICISQQQLKFFTKRLSDDEREELMMVLSKVEGGYQITWVAESIEKRKAYSESRRKNRSTSSKNISKTYDEHMENEIENEEEIKVSSLNKKKMSKIKIPELAPELESTLIAYLNHRKEKKSPIKTQDQLDRFLQKLEKMAAGKDRTAIEILNESIANGWTGIFAIKDNKPQNGKIPTSEAAARILSGQSSLPRTEWNWNNEPKQIEG